MTGWNLPDGCTDRMVDEAFGYKSERRGTYTVVVTRTVEQSITLQVEASSEDEAREDALNRAYTKTGSRMNWSEMDAYDYDVESVMGPEDEEEDPDDARDARIDYLMDRDR